MIYRHKIIDNSQKVVEKLKGVEKVKNTEYYDYKEEHYIYG